MIRAYLDLETTFEGSISVLGVYRPDKGVVQLVGGGVSDVNVYTILEGVTILVTFNGSCFDLPIVKKRLYIDLKRDFTHCDLLHICRRQGLRGGLKMVEQRLGIVRKTVGITGWDAPRLWHRYETLADEKALHTLLQYNYEDVVNLAQLEACLAGETMTRPMLTVQVMMR